jgi:glycerol-3-phosphate acyltransferase PlsY
MNEALGVLIVSLAYFIGSVPVAYLVARWMRGVDIRGVGSGNVGAANTIVHVGLLPGFVVLAIDVGKGAVAVLLTVGLGLVDWVSYAVIVAVVVGHNWPAMLGFRGGRGVAPILGVSVAFSPLVSLVSLFPVAAVLWRTRNIVPAAISGFLMLNILIIVTGQPLEQVLLCLGLTALALTAHLQRTGGRVWSALRRWRWRSVLFIE